MIFFLVFSSLFFKIKHCLKVLFTCCCESKNNFSDSHVTCFIFRGLGGGITFTGASYLGHKPRGMIHWKHFFLFF